MYDFIEWISSHQANGSVFVSQPGTDGLSDSTRAGQCGTDPLFGSKSEHERLRQFLGRPHRPSMLPPDPEHFVGRDDDLDRLNVLASRMTSFPEMPQASASRSSGPLTQNG